MFQNLLNKFAPTLQGAGGFTLMQVVPNDPGATAQQAAGLLVALTTIIVQIFTFWKSRKKTLNEQAR